MTYKNPRVAVSLEQPLFEWVQAQAESRGISMSQYLRDLALQEREREGAMGSPSPWWICECGQRNRWMNATCTRCPKRHPKAQTRDGGWYIPSEART